MVLSIRELSEDTLARRVYEEQRSNSWPGLAKETEHFCQNLKIDNCNTTLLIRTRYKKVLLEACHTKNEEQLRRQGKGKCERIKDETYGRKDYLGSKNISNARLYYRTGFFMQPFAGIYSHDRRFARLSWLCLCSESQEEESYLLSGQYKYTGTSRSSTAI